MESFGKVAVGALAVLVLGLLVCTVPFVSATVAVAKGSDRETIAVQCERETAPRECWIEVVVESPEPGRDNMASAAFVSATERLEIEFWWARVHVQPNANSFGPVRAESFRFGIGPKGESRDLVLVRAVRWLDLNGRLVKETEVVRR